MPSKKKTLPQSFTTKELADLLQMQPKALRKHLTKIPELFNARIITLDQLYQHLPHFAALIALLRS